MSLCPNANLQKFLERHAPDALQSIRRDDPDNYELHHAQVIFGDSHAAIDDGAVLRSTQRVSALRLIQTYTGTAIPAISKLVSTIDERLRNCQRLKTLGGAVAVISGAAMVLLPSLGYQKDSVSIWSALFSCVGGLVTLFAGMLERSSNGQRVTAGDYQMLVNHRAELKGIQRRAEADAVFPLSDPELVKLHNRTAEIADDIARIEP